MPRIDEHIGFSGHMALDATRTDAGRLMIMMGRAVVFLCGMTLHAHTITGGAQCQAMWIVAIAAGNSRMKHFALN
jgi:hypothetical protein